jgi:superfamily II DNA helicase RecQ
MQFKVFVISTDDNCAALDEMNVFLRSHRILEEQHQLVACQGTTAWHFCLKYLEYGDNRNRQYSNRVKIDYRQVLDDVTFSKYSKLREIRKEIAKEEAIPAYAIFLNEELAELAKMEEISIKNMSKVKGIGENRINKYGERIIEMYDNQEKSDNEERR